MLHDGVAVLQPNPAEFNEGRSPRCLCLWVGLTHLQVTHKVIVLGQMRLARSLLIVTPGIFGTQYDAEQRDSCSFSFPLPFSCSPCAFLFSFPLSGSCLVLGVELRALCVHLSATPLRQTRQAWYYTSDLKELLESSLLCTPQSHVSEETGSIPTLDRGGEAHHCPTLYSAT